MSVNGVIDEVTGQEDGGGYVVGFLGGEQATHPDAWAASDPFELVKRWPAGPDAIPFLLIHGADDTWAPGVADSFQAALVAAGYDSRLVEIPGTGHIEAMQRKDSVEAIAAIARGKWARAGKNAKPVRSHTLLPASARGALPAMWVPHRRDVAR